MVRGFWRRITRLTLLGLALMFGMTSVQAADNSLQLVPADAGFYSAMLRNREQLEILHKSKAFQTLVALPQVQAGLAALKAEYGKDKGEFAEFRKALESPMGKELTALLGDAVSDEFFLYGSESWGGLVKLFLAVNNATQFGPARALLEGRAGLDQAEVMGYYALKALSENLKLVQVPELVVGFKIKETERAEKLLKQFEEVLYKELEKAPPQIAKLYKQVTVGKSKLTTLTLPAALLPWEKMPISDLEQKAGEFAPLVKHLKQMQLTVSLGMHEGFLIVALSPSTATVAKLSGQGPLLKDTAEFKLLAKAGTNKLTDINFSSKNYLAPMYEGNVEGMDSMLDFIKSAIKKAPLPEDRQAKIVKDLEDLVKDFKAAQPTIGAALSFNFMTARGTEGYAYDWTKQPGIDGTRPLTLLDHVGGNPILFGIVRGKVDVNAYKTFVKYVRLTYGHLDALAQENLPNEEAKKVYSEIAAWLTGAAKKFDAITVDQLYPATADGQLGIVIDGKWTSKEWVTGAKLPKPMPMLEIGLLMGLSDGDLFVKSMTSYRKWLNETVTEMGKVIPNSNIPPLNLPALAKKGDSLYPLPIDTSGLDRQFLPVFGVGKTLGVFACGEDHVHRLLTRKALKLEGGPLAARMGQPLSGASFVDFPALVDALAPWVELGVGEALKEGVKDEKQVAEGMKSLATVLRVLKCIKVSSSATYLENGATVTHAETVIKDLE